MKRYKRLFEAGEADQDYDTDLYDGICRYIESKIPDAECEHREFDKYQGVYIRVRTKTKGTKLWTESISRINLGVAIILITDDGEDKFELEIDNANNVMDDNNNLIEFLSTNKPKWPKEFDIQTKEQA